MTYPLTPGYKSPGPSRHPGLQGHSLARAGLSRLLAAIKLSPKTADECAEALGQSVLSVRPRLSELHRLGMIVDSGMRRPNISGHNATVWRVREEAA